MRQFAILTLTALPILAVVAMVATYAVNVPFQDEWDWSVTHVLRGDLPQLRFDEFWKLGNEHRVFLPTILMAAIGHATNLNMIVPLYVKIAITALVLGVLVSTYCRTSGFRASRAGIGPWIAVPVSLLLFSLAQWPRWIDVRPIPSTLAILGMTGAVWAATAAPSPRRFAYAVAFAVVSSLSYFAGNITWLTAGIALLLGGWGRRYLVAWTVCALFVLVPYTIDFLASDSVARTGEPASVGSMLQFLLAFLGSTMSSKWGDPQELQAVVFGVFGVAAAISMGFWLAKRPGGLRQALPWLAIGVWVVLNAAAAAYGRTETVGISGARAPKYTVFGTQFWIAVAVMSCLLLGDRGSPRRLRYFGGAVALVIAAGLVNGTVGALPAGEPFAQRLRNGREMLLIADTVVDAELAVLHPRPTVIREFLPGLMERRVSFLAGRQALEFVDQGRAAGRAEVRAPFETSWRVEVLDRPGVDFHVGWSAAQAGATLIVQALDVDGPRELLRLPLSGEAPAGSVNADLRSFRGREIHLVVRIQGSGGELVTLIDPGIVYTMDERE